MTKTSWLLSRHCQAIGTASKWWPNKSSHYNIIIAVRFSAFDICAAPDVLWEKLSGKNNEILAYARPVYSLVWWCIFQFPQSRMSRCSQGHSIFSPWLEVRCLHYFMKLWASTCQKDPDKWLFSTAQSSLHFYSPRTGDLQDKIHEQARIFNWMPAIACTGTMVWTSEREGVGEWRGMCWVITAPVYERG